MLKRLNRGSLTTWLQEFSWFAAAKVGGLAFIIGGAAFFNAAISQTPLTGIELVKVLGPIIIGGILLLVGTYKWRACYK